MIAMLMLATALPILPESPKIDGKVDPGEWKDALTFDFDHGRGAKGYLAFTGKEFVFAARMKHENREWIFSHVTDHDSGVWDDDSVDLYFAVPGRKGFRHIIANYGGTIYDANVSEVRPDLSWESDARAAGGFDDATGLMTIEVAVPVGVIAPAATSSNGSSTATRPSASGRSPARSRCSSSTSRTRTSGSSSTRSRVRFCAPSRTRTSSGTTNRRGWTFPSRAGRRARCRSS